MANNMFKIGDKVRIKEYTIDVPGLYWLSEMDRFHGIETYIKDIEGCWYHLEKGSYEGSDTYAYAESWLELIEEDEFEINENELEGIFNG